jgi:glutamyl-tRNA reductase
MIDMQENFRAITLSYKNAPIEVREMAALSEQGISQLLGQIKEVIGVKEALIISTCNRTEIYYSAACNLKSELLTLLAAQNNFTNLSVLADAFDSLDDQSEAVKHLFRVSTGLEAQVVGDIQIGNQVKRAYQASADLELAGPFLHRLMHTIFFANKRVVQETAFKDGAASVSYVATELVRTFAKEIIEPRIMVLGVGEIGEDVAKNLVENCPGKVTIVNRTIEKAEKLALECGFEVQPFEKVWETITDSDIIISSINTGKTFITKEQLAEIEVLNFKYFIDLSVPRSIDLNVEELPGTILYNVDNLQQKADEAQVKRLAAIPAVEQIIEETILDFNDWAKEMMVSPTIQKLKTALEEIRTAEMAKFMKELDQSQSEVVDKVTKSLMNKILKMPIIQLKAACKRGDADAVIGVINELFNLEEETKQH